MATKKSAVPALSPVEAANLALARAAAAAADEARASDVLLLDLRGLVDYTDFAVVASCPSETRLTGVGRRVEKALREAGGRILSCQGVGGGWMLYDAGDVVVHLLDLSLRDFYQLEHLWGDAPRLDFETRDSHARP